MTQPRVAASRGYPGIEWRKERNPKGVASHVRINEMPEVNRAPYAN
jgi:hypothetical protein